MKDLTRLCLSILLAGLSVQGQSAGPEPLDLTMYQRIRDEGYYGSHVMEYASGLFDGIGPRLTGSPNLKRAHEWTRDQLAAMGCANAHLESWGEFGMGWRQRNVWVRMTAPDAAVLIAQAAPWSPATKGVVSAALIQVELREEGDFARYKGKLAGKVVLLGAMRDPASIDAPLLTRLDDRELTALAQYPLDDGMNKQNFFGDDRVEQAFARRAFDEKAGAFLASEGALAVIVASRDNGRGGNAGEILVDSNDTFGWFIYQPAHAMKVPLVVMALEHFGRLYRLTSKRVPVSIEMNVDTEFTGDHEPGYNTIAEIPAADPSARDEVVMFGAHLDSWAAGTGATDNGAGVIIAMEAMRILKTLGVQPRRTIRVALWGGEEQGLLGSRGYVRQHLGTIPLSMAPEQSVVPEFLRKPGGPLTLKSEQKLVSVYFNSDSGGGRFRGMQVQENAAAVPIVKQWIEPLRDLGVTTVGQQTSGPGDYSPFDAVGVPAFQFIQDPLDYKTRSVHSNMDTYERLIPADLQQAAIVEATLVYNAAMRNEMMPRKPLPRPELFERQAKPLPGVMPGVQ